MADLNRNNRPGYAGIGTGEHSATTATTADVGSTSTATCQHKVVHFGHTAGYLPTARCGQDGSLKRENGIASNGGNIPHAIDGGRTGHRGE